MPMPNRCGATRATCWRSRAAERRGSRRRRFGCVRFNRLVGAFGTTLRLLSADRPAGALLGLIDFCFGRSSHRPSSGTAVSPPALRMLRPPPPGGRIFLSVAELTAAIASRSPRIAGFTNMRPGDRSGRRRRGCVSSSLGSCLIVARHRCRRARRRASTGRAATTRASRSSPAIPRRARRAATATRAAGLDLLLSGTAALGGSIRDLLAEEPGEAAGREPLLRVGRQGRGAGRECARPDRNSIDRIGGDYRHFDIPANPGCRPCKQACEAENRCRAWTYRAAGLCRPGGAVLSQGQDQGAAAQAVLHVGRGAIASGAR